MAATAGTTLVFDGNLACKSAPPLFPNAIKGRSLRMNKQSRTVNIQFTRIQATIVPSSSTTTTKKDTGKALNLKEIPGSYGMPVFGSIRDRLDYFWFQGLHTFLTSRQEKYDCSVFRCNMPPGPPFFPDSRVIMLLDQKSFQILFDTSKIDKRNVFTGTYMPSTDFTGGYRVLSYLDPSEEAHPQLKAFCFDILKTNGRRWIPEFHTAVSKAFDKWEKNLAKSPEGAEINSVVDSFTLDFLTKAVLDQAASAPGLNSLEDQGPCLINKWLAAQLAPLLSIGLPKPIEEILFHSFPLPFIVVKKQYDRICAFFETYGDRALDMAQAEHGISKDEALHNLVFFICFNTFGGFVRLFPVLLKRISDAGLTLQKELATEIRNATSAQKGHLGMKALEQMPLLTSTVYEVLRMNPPVVFQYGRAKNDLIIETHDAAYEVKQGEMLCGYQPLATRDPVVFQNPDEFLPKRFMGEEGNNLLRHLLWSNGPENETSHVHNKQCAGKDFVVLIARQLVAELFLRYDSFQVGEPVPKGPGLLYHFTALVKRS